MSFNALRIFNILDVLAMRHDLSQTQQNTLHAMIRRADENGQCFETPEAMAALWGWKSASHIYAARKVLIEKGLIKPLGRQMTNVGVVALVFQVTIEPENYSRTGSKSLPNAEQSTPECGVNHSVSGSTNSVLGSKSLRIRESNHSVSGSEITPECGEDNKEEPPIEPPIEPSAQARRVKADSKPTSTTPGFDRWWKAYPTGGGRRVRRAKCLQIWKKKNLEAAADQIIKHTELSKLSNKWRGGFEPMTTTYLNNDDYLDDPPPPESHLTYLARSHTNGHTKRLGLGAIANGAQDS